jgi:hypothetical protein
MKVYLKKLFVKQGALKILVKAEVKPKETLSKTTLEDGGM